MGWKLIFSLIFVLFMIVSLFFYWILPLNTTEFNQGTGNSNFSLTNSIKGMQFYENMRFPDSKISYRILDCPLKKKNDMEQAFVAIEEITVLDFYSVNSDEKILIGCDSKSQIKGGMFIAGEGGPTNISQSGNFNVILNGEILLREESECERPNVAIHELLHVLGFEHSSNSDNIMYNFSKCYQTIGDDIPKLINELYAIPSYPDLVLTNVSAIMHGRYLDTNISIRNFGLKESGVAKIKIFADGKFIGDFDLEPIEIGYGRVLMLTNVFIPQFKIEQLEFIIDSSFNELDKQNNKVVLSIKKK